LHISAGKDHKTVVDFVEVLEAKQGDRRAIKQVSCDMSPHSYDAYITVILIYLGEHNVGIQHTPYLMIGDTR
jgi:IS4 transposase